MGAGAQLCTAPPLLDLNFISFVVSVDMSCAGCFMLPTVGPAKYVCSSSLSMVLEVLHFHPAACLFLYFSDCVSSSAPSEFFFFLIHVVPALECAVHFFLCDTCNLCDAGRTYKGW